MMNNPYETDHRADAGRSQKKTEYVDLPEHLHHVTEDGVATRFKRVHRDHRFTDDEVAALLRGEKIRIPVVYSDGKPNTVYGGLQGGSFIPEDKPDSDPIVFVAFTPEPDPEIYAVGEWVERPGEQTKFKKTWGRNDNWPGHTFSPDEIQALLAGEVVGFEAVSKKGNEYEANGRLQEGTYNGHKYVGFSLLPRD